MKDIIDNIDNIDENIENAEKEKRIRRESRKLLEEKRIKEKKTEFQVKFEKLKNDPIVQEHLFGKFADINSTTGDRINANKLVIETLRRLSMEGKIPKGHELYMEDKYAGRLKSTGSQLFRELGEVNLKTNIHDGISRSNEAQGVLNDLCIGKRGEDAPEGTATNHKLRLQKLNLIEALATGMPVDYSSTIQTRYETNQYKQEPRINNRKNKQFKSSEYDRAREGILKKLREKPEKVTDAEVAFVLAGDFMFRISTIRKLPVEQLDPKRGTIEVYAHQNKSKQAYLATGSYIDPENPEYKEILSLVIQRAKIRNSDRRNEDGTIPIITATEGYLFNGGFKKILRDYNIKGKWKGKYHALRHMGAQNRYDEIRGAIEEEDIAKNLQKSKEKMQIEALVELNYAVGHSAEHIDTTMGYVKNIW